MLPPSAVKILGKAFGCGCANALWGAGDEDAFAAQMKIHGIAR